MAQLDTQLLQLVLAAISENPAQYDPKYYRNTRVCPETFDLAGWTAQVCGMRWCDGDLDEDYIFDESGTIVCVDYWAAARLGLTLEQHTRMFSIMSDSPHAALDYAHTLIMATLEDWTDAH